jgi:hypothetical protein
VGSDRQVSRLAASKCSLIVLHSQISALASIPSNLIKSEDDCSELLPEVKRAKREVGAETADVGDDRRN